PCRPQRFAATNDTQLGSAGFPDQYRRFRDEARRRRDVLTFSRRKAKIVLYTLGRKITSPPLRYGRGVCKITFAGNQIGNPASNGNGFALRLSESLPRERKYKPYAWQNACQKLSRSSCGICACGGAAGSGCHVETVVPCRLSNPAIVCRRGL